LKKLLVFKVVLCCLLQLCSEKASSKANKKKRIFVFINFATVNLPPVKKKLTKIQPKKVSLCRKYTCLRFALIFACLMHSGACQSTIQH